MSYFRLLKKIDVLNYLTAYLIQQKKLSIPGVGTLRLVQHPAQLNVAEKRIEPPSFSVEVGAEEEVSIHQLNFLNNTLGQKDEGSLQSLQSFGRAMHRQMNEGGFEWERIGTFSATLPAVSVAALEPVYAEKVIRQDVSHTMLVGERELTSAQVADLKTKDKSGRKFVLSISIGWLLLLLSLVGIAFLLYSGRFKTSAAGSKLPATMQTAN